nr:hypothetical protein [Tanacetum cinerariifolium]GFA75061.1 hypothetical protein [Tanacetum cinerariifolium]
HVKSIIALYLAFCWLGSPSSPFILIETYGNTFFLGPGSSGGGVFTHWVLGLGMTRDLAGGLAGKRDVQELQWFKLGDECKDFWVLAMLIPGVRWGLALLVLVGVKVS